MKKIGLVLLIIALAAFSLSAAKADMTFYPLKGLSFPVPDGMYVLTLEDHNLYAAGLGGILSQDYVNGIFDSQPGLQLNGISIEPVYDLLVFQVPEYTADDFSKMDQRVLLELKDIFEQTVESQGITISGEVQIVNHPQAKFFQYEGYGYLDGQKTYVISYTTKQNDILTNIQLQTYFEPADADLKALLMQMVQSSIFTSST